MVALLRFDVVFAVMVFTLTTVSCQSQVRGFTGDGVLLPCFYRGGDLPQKVTAFWRDKDNKNVLDIKQSLPDFPPQDPKFRDRVELFPDQFMKGNFSIVLNNLQLSDSGDYECDILKVDFKQKVNLLVSEKPAVKATVRTTTTVKPSGAAAATFNSFLLTLLSVPLSLLFSL